MCGPSKGAEVPVRLLASPKVIITNPRNTGVSQLWGPATAVIHDITPLMMELYSADIIQAAWCDFKRSAAHSPT